MNEGSQNKNITASQLIKLGVGMVHGIIVNSHTNGTIKLQDGDDDTVGAVATGVLSIAGGALVPANFAMSILTNDLTNPVDGSTVVVGTKTYRFKSTMLAINDVQIGASVTATLLSLKKAINGNGLAGTDYFAGTVAHTLVIATASDATTLTIYSRTIGAGNNALATTQAGTSHCTWEGTTLGSGTGASIVGVATAGATFTIAGIPYYFTKLLTETVMGVAGAIANEILWVTTDAVTLDNMKKAINATGSEGTDYSTGTSANDDVIATTNTDTAQTVQAINFGTLGNAVSSTSGMLHATFASATLTGGTNGFRLMINTFTFPTGSGIYKFPAPIDFKDGLFAVVGGTLDCTVCYN